MVDEVIQEFLLETRENLDVLDNELVAMEEYVRFMFFTNVQREMAVAVFSVGEIGGQQRTMTRRALLEIIRVLRSLVGALSPATVLHFYVDVPPVPLPGLLGALLPTTSTLTDAASVAAAKRALTDVASLVSLVCLAVGPAASTKHLLPEVDRFFGQLAHLRAAPQPGVAASLCSCDEEAALPAAPDAAATETVVSQPAKTEVEV